MRASIFSFLLGRNGESGGGEVMDCTQWDNPGAAPFRGGDVAAAIARYKLPEPIANELTIKVMAGQSDAVVYVTRDGIQAPYGKAENLRDMHHRGGMCPGPVRRDKWADDAVYGLLVYCVRGQCVGVPIVCGNISRIDYVPHGPAPRALAPAPGDAPGQAWAPYVPKVQTVPEPSSLWLVGAALVALRGVRRGR